MLEPILFELEKTSGFQAKTGQLIFVFIIEHKKVSYVTCKRNKPKLTYKK
jgi:hypothetical protein